MTSQNNLEPTAAEIERVAAALKKKVQGFTTWEDAARAAILAMDRRADKARIAALEKAVEDDGIHMAELMTKYEALLASPPSEPVAVVGPGWQLRWFSSDPLTKIHERTGLRIGDALYRASPPAPLVSVDFAKADEVVTAIDGRIIPPAPAVAVPAGYVGADWGFSPPATTEPKGRHK